MILKKKLFFCLLAVIFCPFINAQTTILLQPDSVSGKDTKLHELHPNTNFGSSNEFMSFTWTFSGSTATSFSLMEFDFSAIPVGAIITNAKLSLYHNSLTASQGHSGDNACYLKKITSTWDENLVTWNTMPTTTIVDQILLPTSNTGFQNYTNIDITNFAIDWQNNPGSNFGMMLELIDETPFKSMKFCSSDFPNPILRPKLEITYKFSGISLNPEKKIAFDIFPNPASDIITIDFGDFTSHLVALNIYNSKGQFIEQKAIPESSVLLDISSYEKGVYYIKVFSNDFVKVEKIIID